MQFIDTHAHLYLDEFTEDLPQVIERARMAGSSHIFLPNIDKESIASMLRVCQQYPDLCFPMIGLHPTSVNASYEQELIIVEQQLQDNPAFVAIGEIGLDLYWDKTYLKEQLMAFDFQVRLALDNQLPVVIHCRDAFEELYQALLPYQKTDLTGIFHSFTGSPEEAHQFMEFEGFMFGINGVVTFRNSNLSATLAEIPLSRITLETDAPYLTPVPFRGKRNETSYLKYTLSKVAEIYKKTEEEIARTTSENALGVFFSTRQEQRF